MRFSQTYSLFHIVSRVMASVFGVYVFIFGLASMGILSSVYIGIAYEEARLLFNFLNFLLFLFLFFWAFLEINLVKVWLILFGGGATMLLLSWWMSDMVLGV